MTSGVWVRGGGGWWGGVGGGAGAFTPPRRGAGPAERPGSWLAVEGEVDYHPDAGRRTANYGHAFLNLDVRPPFEGDA